MTVQKCCRISQSFFSGNTLQSHSKIGFFHLGLEAAGYATAKVAATFRDESLFSDLEKINIPTIILHGIHDKVCLPQLALALKEGIKKSKLVWFEHSGHGLFWEQRDQFNKELNHFIVTQS